MSEELKYSVQYSHERAGYVGIEHKPHSLTARVVTGSHVEQSAADSELMDYIKQSNRADGD